MHTPFPLFRSHLDLAHAYWRQLLLGGETAIDATCGNGYDAAILASFIFKPSHNSGALYLLDIQEVALKQTMSRLQQQLEREALSRVYPKLGSHCSFPQEIEPNSVSLIVYNLGYLPGGDKSQTTKAALTVASVEKGCTLIKDGGALSITCYPGHEEGEREEAALLAWAHQLSSKEWSVCHHRWLNRQKAPSLLLIQKRVNK